jgi:exonuclease VII large subunit
MTPSLTRIPSSTAPESEPLSRRSSTPSLRSLNLTEEAATLEQQRLGALSKTVQAAFETWATKSQMPVVQALEDSVAVATQANQELRKDMQKKEEGAKKARKVQMLAIVALGLILIGVGALLWWKVGLLPTPPPQSLTGAPTMEAIQAQRTQFDSLTATIKAKQEQAQRLEEEISRLDTKMKRDQETITSMAGSMAALSASRTQAQDELANLQRLNQQFQFRLLQMDSPPGPQVVIQIPNDAQQVTVDGKQYLIVTPAPPPNKESKE